MFGYIDPAVGATVMQLVVAGTVGLGAVVKLKWHTIRDFFGGSGTPLDPTSDRTSVVDDHTDHQV